MKPSVKISKGNSKLGKIPNVSFPPVKACGNCDGCKTDCYAVKFYRLYPSVRKAWSHNWNLYRKDPERYFREISEHIQATQRRFFRWHVAGDIVDQPYLEEMSRIAKDNPSTTFLVFTKMYDLDFTSVPDNLSIVLSVWPGMPFTNASNLPLAFMQDGTETRIENAIECPGGCEHCGMCFNLREIGKNVVFYKH